MSERVVERSEDSVLKLNFFSHATLACRDLEKTRNFYTKFLGLDVVRTSEHSMNIRLGSDTVIVVVQQPNKPEAGVRQNHNGLDVLTREDVAHCHKVISEQGEQWGITRVTRPIDQHGTYSFLFVDLDGNWWEILSNPPKGYSWMFKKGDDLENWGAGESGELNPNNYVRKRRGSFKET